MNERSTDQLPTVPANLGSLLKELEQLGQHLKPHYERKPEHVGSALVIKRK